MHPQHRLAQRRAKRTRHARPHQQRASQPRPLGVSHHVNIAQIQPRFVQNLPSQWQNPSNMVTASQLRHHAAKGLVHFNLAMQRIRQQHRQAAALGFDECDAGFVAAGFDA